MKLSLLVLLAACTPSPSPSPPPPPSDQTVYTALTSAGCLQATDGGLAAVAAEHRLPTQPGWLACLYDGGTVQNCAVPCDGGGK